MRHARPARVRDRPWSPLRNPPSDLSFLSLFLFFFFPPFFPFFFSFSPSLSPPPRAAGQPARRAAPATPARAPASAPPTCTRAPRSRPSHAQAHAPAHRAPRRRTRYRPRVDHVAAPPAAPLAARSATPAAPYASRLAEPLSCSPASTPGLPRRQASRAACEPRLRRRPPLCTPTRIMRGIARRVKLHSAACAARRLPETSHHIVPASPPVRHSTTAASGRSAINGATRCSPAAATALLRL